MFLYTLLVALFTLLIIYISGSLVINFSRVKQPEESYYNTFIRLILGVLTVVFIYSVYITKGNTINWGLLIVGLMYLLIERKRLIANHQFRDLNKIFRFRQNLNPLLFIFGICTLVYSFYALFYFNKPFNNILHYDDVYYTFLSSKMYISGTESTLPQYGVFHNTAMPYHYGELWLTPLINKFTNLNPLLIHSVVLKSSFTSILMLGMVALTRIFTKKRVFYLFAICSVYIAPIILEYTDISQKDSNAFFLKLILASMFFVWFTILIKENSRYWFFPILFLPIINIAYSVISFSTLGLMAIIIGIKEKSVKRLLGMAIPMFIITIFIFIFYTIQSKVANNNGFSFESITKYYNIKFLISDSISHLKGILMYSIYFFPLGILLIYLFIKKRTSLKKLWTDNYKLLVFVIILFCIGNIAQLLMYPFVGVDSGQMNKINYILLFNILVYFSFLVVEQFIYSNQKIVRAIFYLFVSIVSIYNICIFVATTNNTKLNPTDWKSEKFISSVSSYFKHNSLSYNGVRILSNTENNFIDISKSRGELRNAYWFIPHSTTMDFLYITNINYIDSVYDDITIKKPLDRNNLFLNSVTREAMRNEPFSIFSEKYKFTHGNTALDTLQFEFVKEYGASFIAIGDSRKLPEIFAPYVDTIIIDDKTNESFVFLNRID